MSSGVVSALANLFAGLGAAGLAALSRSRLPATWGTIRCPAASSGLPGLRSPVEVIRDRWGVPHIYATCATDALFAQGFVHAQDRLWQMEFQRRLVAGRLAEVLGEAALPADRWLRTLCLRRVAEAEVAQLPAEVRGEMEAYAAGVNAWIEMGRLPVEFVLLRYRPEPWTPADSTSWAKMMAWSLSVNWETELVRALLIALLGPERAAELEPPYAARWPTIMSARGRNHAAPGGQAQVPRQLAGADEAGAAGADITAAGSSALGRSAAARPFTGSAAQEGLGSNNWIIGPARSATGMPLLASDMHLLMSEPAIWYENHLVSRPSPDAEPDLEVTGVTFPGIPGVVAGHNAHVAWSFTNGFADVQDLFLERLRRTDDGRVQYEYRGEWLDAEVRREQIRIKGGRTAIEEVVVTRHGPIINALAPDLADRLAGGDPTLGLALRWTALEPGMTVAAAHYVNRARSCSEVREALRYWACPIQNTVYADTAGNIGYSFPGWLPMRARGDGSVPVPGWSGEYEWTGYVPYDELPHLLNPAQGFIVTANNRPAGDDYPHLISRDFFGGDRAQRITELIESQEKIDLAHIRRMQFDLISPTARIVAGHLARLQPDDPELAAVVGLFRDWDGKLSADSPAAAVYQAFMRHLLTLLLSHRLGDLTERYAGKGPTPLLAETSLFGHQSWHWMTTLLEQAPSHWFDLGGEETRDQVMERALREAVEDLKLRLGAQVNDWAWGKLHKLTCSHALSSVPALARLFNRGPYPLGGDSTTVWATGSGQHTMNGSGVIGPPYRFIADLSDWRNSVSLLAPGQSGQPGSRHYDDQMQAWFTGGYHPMLWAREDVEREAVARLELRPIAP